MRLSRPDEQHGQATPELRGAAGSDPKTTKAPRTNRGAFCDEFGDDLLSQGVYPQVPSALAVLTSVFGMGTGVTLPVWSPKSVVKESPIGAFRALQSKHEHNFQPSPRPISTGQLHTLPCFHFRPINVMVLSRALLR